MLRTLAALDARGPALHDGSRVQFGWSVLTLRASGDGQELRVCEPDFFGDTASAVVPSVDVTLTVIGEQLAVLRAERVEGVDARFDEFVLVWPGALCAAEIFLQRREPQFGNATGWFIGDLARLDNPPAADTLEALRVYDVFTRRRSAMKLLALPPGYAVVMHDAEVVEISNRY